MSGQSDMWVSKLSDQLLVKGLWWELFHFYIYQFWTVSVLDWWTILTVPSFNHTEKTAEAEPLSNAKNKASNNLPKILASFAGHCGVRHISSLKSLNSRPAFFNWLVYAAQLTIKTRIKWTVKQLTNWSNSGKFSCCFWFIQKEEVKYWYDHVKWHLN